MDHVLELCARVVYCRRHTVQVECVVTALLPEWCQGAPGEGGEPGEFSHKGYFTILNMTEYGHKRPLAVALDTRDDPAAQVCVSVSVSVIVSVSLSFCLSVCLSVHVCGA